MKEMKLFIHRRYVYVENLVESTKKNTRTEKLTRFQNSRPIYKNKLHFYMLAMNKWNWNFLNTVYKSRKNILRNKSGKILKISAH